MKVTKSIFFLTGIYLIGALMPLQAQNRGIMDYFELYTKNFLKDWPGVGDDVFVIQEKDPANGYVEFSRKMLDFGKIRMVLWNQRPNGRDLIVQTTRGCGPACYQSEIRFLEFEGDQENDITDRILSPALQIQIKAMADEAFPQIRIDDHHYVIWYDLPRLGLDIPIRMESGFTMGDFPPEEEGITWLEIGKLKYNGDTFDFVKK